MRKYISPEIETIKFDTVDVIETSGNFEIIDGDASGGAELEGDVIIGA